MSIDVCIRTIKFIKCCVQYTNLIVSKQFKIFIFLKNTKPKPNLGFEIYTKATGYKWNTKQDRCMNDGISYTFIYTPPTIFTNKA